MPIKDLLKRAGLIATTTGGNDSTDFPAPLEQVENSAVQYPPPITGGTTMTAAQVLLRRRSASSSLPEPPVIVEKQLSAAESIVPLSVRVNQECLEQFRSAAARSPVEGYVNLERQLAALGGVITDQKMLYLAAIKSVGAAGISEHQIMKAIADRVNLIKAEQSDIERSLEEGKRSELSRGQEQVKKIGKDLEILRKEIEDKQRACGELEEVLRLEMERVGSIESDFQDAERDYSNAARAILSELERQQAMVRAAMGKNI
ncbi:MAG TPA: hypothetical protein VJH71_00195 [Candidatus Paceibacterota bacterium]